MAVLWVGFAIAINWLGVGERLYEHLLLEPHAVARGEVWRVFTGPLMHVISGNAAVSHITFNLLMLYFFGDSLQRQWGNRRFLTMLMLAALAGEGVQLGIQALVGHSFGTALAQPVLLGSYAMATAAMIAWAFSHQGGTVLLFFVLPVSTRVLVGFTIGFSVLLVIAAGHLPEGVLAPFGGMGVGYLLGAGTPSPVRRWWLRRKLRKIERSSATKGSAPPMERGRLRLIQGLKEDPPPRSTTRGKGDPWLN